MRRLPHQPLRRSQRAGLASGRQGQDPTRHHGGSEPPAHDHRRGFRRHQGRPPRPAGGGRGHRREHGPDRDAERARDPPQQPRHHAGRDRRAAPQRGRPVRTARRHGRPRHHGASSRAERPAHLDQPVGQRRGPPGTPQPAVPARRQDDRADAGLLRHHVRRTPNRQGHQPRPGPAHEHLPRDPAAADPRGRRGGCARDARHQGRGSQACHEHAGHAGHTARDEFAHRSRAHRHGHRHGRDRIPQRRPPRASGHVPGRAAQSRRRFPGLVLLSRALRQPTRRWQATRAGAQPKRARLHWIPSDRNGAWRDSCRT